jgi:uncharacterized protein YxeA
MKKILTLFIIGAIVMTSIFTKSAQIQLVNTIKETPVSYNLYYKNEYILDKTVYSITVDSLAKDGETDKFEVTATSNMNKPLSINVKIDPKPFKTTLNGNKPYNSGIVPQVEQDTKLIKLEAGKHENKLVNSFKLFWFGTEDLPAGDYVSNIKIEYTIK